MHRSVPEIALSGLLGAIVLVGCSPEPQPSVPPPPVLTSSERTTMLQEQLDARWEGVAALYPQAIRPEVDRVRLISSADFASITIECLQEAGFEVDDTGDGGISYGAVPDAQRESLAITEYECAAKYPIDPSDLTPLTDDEIAFLYAYQTGTLRHCLEDRGYAVPDPSSLSKYLADYHDGTGPWTPYANITVTGDKWNELRRDCPEIPSGFRGN